MQSDEQLYELSAKELAESPRQGLLIKCMAKTEGNEIKAKALYIETRVEEMKSQIKEESKKEMERLAEKEELNRLERERLEDEWFKKTLLGKILIKLDDIWFKVSLLPGWVFWLAIILFFVYQHLRINGFFGSD